MPFNMNTMDATGVDKNLQLSIPAGGGDNDYRQQWAPTHLASPSNSSKKDAARHSRQHHPINAKTEVTRTPTAVIENDASRFPLVPFASSNFSPGYPPGVDPSLFDQQEKVSVRLVQNRGLVVEESDDKVEPEVEVSVPRYVDPHPSYTMFHPAAPVSSQRCSHTKQTNCMKNGARTSCPGHSSKISNSLTKGGIRLSPSPPKYYDGEECAYSEQCKSTLSHAPFSRTRHGSASAGGSSGASSLTPLMTGVDPMKDSHRIPVIVKPSSLKQQQGGSNIHLYCALVLSFSASLFMSLTLLLAKVLKNRDHHPISIAFWRYLGILIPSVPLGMYYFLRGKKSKVVGSVWPIHDMDKAANGLALLMRGVLGSTAVILRFCSLKYLTIGESSVISYSAPVFAAIVAPFCVRKDKGGVLPVVMGLVAVFGVFLICQPPFLGGNFDIEILKGVFLASLSTLCASGVLIIVRNLLQKVHFSLMIFALGIWGVFEAGVLALSLDVLKVPELLPDIVMMFGVAILTFFGQLFVLLAMRMGQVGSAVSVMRSCDIFLSFLWQYLFLKTEPEISGILSATLIILAVWFICFRKWLISLRENHTIRQQLSLMLY